MMAFVCLIVVVFLYVYLPETKGRSLEDMSVYFAEITGDTSIFEAEQKLRGEQEMTEVEAAAQAGAPERASGTLT